MFKLCQRKRERAVWRRALRLAHDPDFRAYVKSKRVYWGDE